VQHGVIDIFTEHAIDSLQADELPKFVSSFVVSIPRNQQEVARVGALQVP
jgi:hypothetical protein